MDSIHTVFGLTIRSNLPVPGLAPLEPSEKTTDFRMHLGVSPSCAVRRTGRPEELAYESPYMDDSGQPALRIWKSADNRYLRLAYYDGMQFWLEREGKEIWVIWPETSTLEDACSYLLGPVLGVALRLRGVTCLHASAVALDGYAVAFAGAEGTGKSTIAAAFAQEGHGVLADDIVALTERGGEFLVAPAYPHVCLWSDSVAALYGSAKALPPFSSGWEKQRLFLGNGDARFASCTLPLGAVYFLGERRSEQAPLIEVLQPQTALLSLVADTFANKILDRELRAQEFEVLGRLVMTVPVHRVFPHREASKVHDLCRAIREDFTSSKRPKPAQT